MSIENERKYILDLSIDHLEEIREEYEGTEEIIEQSYVKDGRIRQIGEVFLTRVISNQIIFTWKYALKDGTLIEIETDLSPNDYQSLRSESTNLIIKKRIKFKYDELDWDIDFLLSGGEHYITIAECEMPAGMDKPANLPQFVKDTLIYLVPRDKSKKWTNKKLTNPKKTIKMVNSVRELENG